MSGRDGIAIGETIRAVGIDLFGTLMRPPTGSRLLALLIAAGIKIDPLARAAVARGFIPAMLLGERQSAIPQLVRLSLTRNFESIEELVEVAKPFVGTGWNPPLRDMYACKRAQELAVKATVLVPHVADALELCRIRGMHLIIVSDVSSFWKPVIEFHGLSRWFDTMVLSCLSGSIKRDGATWRNAVERKGVSPKSAVLIGDSWASDGVCGLRAGTGVIMVGRRARAAAELLLHDAASLLVSDSDGIRADPRARGALDGFAPGLSDEIEANPLRALILHPDGKVGFARLAGVRWRSSLLGALRDVIRMTEPTVG